MSVLGIDEVAFAVLDLPRCKQFCLDWGLTLAEESETELVFESLNTCRLRVVRSDVAQLPPGIEADPTLREIVWGVESEADMARFTETMRTQPGFVQGAGRVGCTDPTGLAVRVQITRKQYDLKLECAEVNTWSDRRRVNQASPAYDRATPVEVGHIVLFVGDLQAATRFYEEVFGFIVSDRYPGRGHFMRCAPRGGHHDLFMLQTPDKRIGLNHVAFTVRDLHEVVGGGLNMSRQGWSTELGPGRHPISSAMFWYFESPLGALWEYYTDEDELTEEWQPREFTPGPTMFAEWAIKGGIDGNTRRQKSVEAPSGKFMTDKPKA